MPGLLVIGDVVTDVVARPTGPLEPGTDTAADIALRPGGSGANTAAWAAHEGARTVLLGRVGADSVTWHRDALRGAGVEPVLVVDPDRPTAVVIAVVADDGERTMVTDRGAGAGLDAADWDDRLLADVGLLHVSGYALFTAAGRRLAAVALAAASARGIPASVDPASCGFIATRGVDSFHRDTRGFTTWFPNLAEARLLTGVSDPDAAAVALSRGGRTVVVTMGAAGFVVAVDGEPIATGTAAKVSVVDTVGAGDAFAGGFLAARLAGAELVSCAEAGAAVAGRAVATPGGRPV